MDATTEKLDGDLQGTPYRPLRFLARGGMGEVVVAEHRELGRPVVLKLLRANLEGDEQLAERLRVEARLLAQLTHPNLVSVLDFGRTRKGRPYLVTELLEGRPLQDHQEARGGTLPVRESLLLALQVLAGLELVHARGFIHRDIKPANLFVVDGPDPARPILKILDFGIAKALSEKDRQALGLVAPTTAGTVVGTPSAMSPEQASARPIDARTDLYALGVVLFRMLTGRAPFVGSAQELLLAHLTEAPPRPSSLAPQPVPAAVEALILRALEKRPDARFQSAREMRAAVEEVIAILDGAGPRASTPSLATPPEVTGGPAPAAPSADPDGPSGTTFTAPVADDTTRRMDRARLPLPPDRRPTVHLLEAPGPLEAPRGPIRDRERGASGAGSAEAGLVLRDDRGTSSSPVRWWPVLVALVAAVLLVGVTWIATRGDG